MSQRVIFDFDGVIHSYTSGWQGVEKIQDPPVEGIREEIQRIRDAGYEVVVLSTRCFQVRGIAAIKEYLKRHNIEVDMVTDEKPPAVVTVDDRAILFKGDPTGLKEQIDNFKPWMQKEGNNE